MFDDLGGHRPQEISQAVRDIGDAENAARWIEQALEGKVVVKPEFRELNGRDFRRVYKSPRQ